MKKGDRVYDKDLKVYGIVKRSEDIHNIFVEFDNRGGGGLYCLDPECEDYDDSLIIVENEKDKITIFVERLKRIGIDVKITGNYPWIYITEINGKFVTERYAANHGFTIAFLPVKKDKEIRFTDIGEIFNLIRNYVD